MDECEFVRSDHHALVCKQLQIEQVLLALARHKNRGHGNIARRPRAAENRAEANRRG